jgi:hypothetical protein
MMSQPIIDDLVAEVSALRRAVLAVALASPSLANVVAELERQKEFELIALLPTQVSDQNIELIRSKIQGLIDVLKAQL